MTRGDHFRDSGHADQVGANGAQIANLGRGFVAWSQQGGVDALIESLARLLRSLQGNLAIGFPVSLGHVGKARAEAVVIGSDERIVHPAG